MFFDAPIRAGYQRGAQLVMLALRWVRALPMPAYAISQLSVEGTAFVLRLPNGRVLTRAELKGATEQLASGEGHPPRRHVVD